MCNTIPGCNCSLSVLYRYDTWLWAALFYKIDVQYRSCLKLHLQALAFHSSVIYDFNVESTAKHLLLTVVLPWGLGQGESTGQVTVFKIHVNCCSEMVQNKKFSLLFGMYSIFMLCWPLVNHFFEITKNICIITSVYFILSDNFHHTRHCMPCTYVLNIARYFSPSLRVILLSYNLWSPWKLRF